MDQVNPRTDEILENARNRILDAKEAILKGVRTQKTYYDRRYAKIPDIKAWDYVSIRLDKHPISLIKKNKLTQLKLEPMKVVATHSGGRALELNKPPGLHIALVISVQHV
jgi:hypothetical protein